MRLLALLALAVLAAGCIKSEPTPAAVDEPAPPAEDLAAAAAPTPPPSTPPTAPPPSSTPPTPPPSTPPTAPTPPPAPPAPPKPADHHAEAAGWVTPQDGPNMTLRHVVPVLAGARNVTVRVELSAAAPQNVSLPVAPGSISIRLLAPDGTEAAMASTDPGEVAVTLDHLAPPSVGDWVAVVTLTGASDGSTAGHQYRAVLHVAY